MLQDLAAAFGLLTRLPFGRLAPDGTDYARAVWAYPVAGAAVGLLGAIAYALCARIGLPPAIAAFWTLAAMVLITGALHEDGLADTADGLGGGRTPQRRLEIMRDSRIGSFGALALMFSLLIRGAAIAEIADPGDVAAALIASGALGRAAIITVLRMARPARPDGMAAALADIPPGAAVAGWAIAIAITALLLPARTGLLVLAAAALTGMIFARLARTRLGGHTGDILGAAELTAECAVLSLLAIP